MKLDSVFKAVDALTALRDAAREIKGSSSGPERSTTSAATPAATSSQGGTVEARLTNVLVAALKEAFDRDHARLELERTHAEEQRRRAEEAMRMEQRRQVLDREIGRLRLLAGAAVIGWLSSMLLFVARSGDPSVASKASLGAGCLALLASLASSFIAQGRINTPADDTMRNPESMPLWLLVVGLALSVLGLLL